MATASGDLSNSLSKIDGCLGRSGELKASSVMVYLRTPMFDRLKIQGRSCRDGVQGRDYEMQLKLIKFASSSADCSKELELI
jgi:hypothetical protein